jgi:hypothetical protein
VHSYSVYLLNHYLHPSDAFADLLDDSFLLTGSHALYPSHLTCLPDHPDPLIYSEMLVIVIGAIPLHLVLQLKQVPPSGEFNPTGYERHNLKLQVLKSQKE